MRLGGGESKWNPTGLQMLHALSLGQAGTRNCQRLKPLKSKPVDQNRTVDVKDKTILHHFETMVETIVCWYLQGSLPPKAEITLD